MQWITNWLHDRDWTNIFHNAAYTLGIIVVFAILIWFGTEVFTADPDKHDNEQCYVIETEGGWFSEVEVCEIVLRDGTVCEIFEFGNAGGIICD